MFYTLWRHARLQVDHWIAHIERLYCVLLVWKHARLHVDSIGLPIQAVSIVFYWLWSHARVQLDSIGLPSLSVSIVFYMHCSSNIKALFPPLLALQFEGLHLTFLVTSQAGLSPRTFRVLRDSKPVPRPLRGQREGLRETVRLPTLSVALLFYML